MKLKNPFKGKKKKEAEPPEPEPELAAEEEAQETPKPKASNTKKSDTAAAAVPEPPAPTVKEPASAASTADEAPKSPKKDKPKKSKPVGKSRENVSESVPPPKGPPPGSVPHEEVPDAAEPINKNLGNANTYVEIDEEEAFADNLPVVKAKDADTNKDFPRFVLHEFKCEGTFEFRSKGKEIHTEGKSINKAIQKFKHNPKKWIAMTYQANSRSWPSNEQEYYMIERKGTSQLWPENPGEGWMAVLLLEYQHLPTFPNNEYPREFRDAYTDEMRHNGVKIHSDTVKPICPGRGQGCCDSPLIKVIGDIDPSDIKQGQVGCCWLLSAISAIAEFDGAVKKLFRKTPDIHLMPKPTPNTYIVTLWDLPTWTEVDIVIDERLAANPKTTFSTSTVLSSKPSDDGELWVCYLEKALSVHCGGWDAITGGQCTHAWAIMTGCKEQYIFLPSTRKNGKWSCHARYNPHKQEWLRHENDIHKCDNETGVWPVPFPIVGEDIYTGDANHEMTNDELFKKMFACDQLNYIVGAASKGGGTDDGLVDNHAYTVIEAVQDAAGTGIDMLKVRNPWGKQCGRRIFQSLVSAKLRLSFVVVLIYFFSRYRQGRNRGRTIR